MPEDETPNSVSSVNPAADDTVGSQAVESDRSNLDGLATPSQPPVMANPPTSNTNAGFQPPKKSKKKWIIGGIVAFLIVLIGSGAIAYFAWYQSPQKVLSDALSNMLSDKYQTGTTNMTASVKTKEADVSFTMDAKSNTKHSQAAVDVNVSIKEGFTKPLDLTVKTEMFIDVEKEAIYLKVRDVDQLVEKIIDVAIDAQLEQMSTFSQKPTQQEINEIRKQVSASFAPVVKKLDDQWIKFDVNNKDSETSKQQKCATDAINDLRTNKATKDEMLGVYKENAFLKIKDTLPTKDGKLGYSLELDEAKAEDFGKAVEKTKFGKAVMSCDESSNTAQSPFDMPSTQNKAEYKNTVIEVRIDQWAHTLNGIKLTTDIEEDGKTSTASAEVSIEYKDVGELAAPKDAADAQELIKELSGSLFGGSSNGSVTPAPTTFSTSNSI